MHRIGRTGRAGFKGTAISLVGPKDWPSYKAIKAFLNDELSFFTVDGLVGKFKGLREKKPNTVWNKAEKKVAAKPAKPKRKAAPKKPKAPIQAPIDVDGFAPMRRKKKPEQE